MRIAHFALLLLLFAGIAHPLWNQTLTISAADMHGVALEGAQVSVTYQKAASLSEDDGSLSGFTGQDGKFIAQLENKVPVLQQSYKVKVAVSAPYWEGETRLYEAQLKRPQKLHIHGARGAGAGLC